MRKSAWIAVGRRRLGAHSETPNTGPEPLLGRVAYLCLQATRQGQASFAHVHEIIAGLQARGWSVELEQPSYSSEGSRLPGALGRALEFYRVQRLVREASHAKRTRSTYEPTSPPGRPLGGQPGEVSLSSRRSTAPTRMCSWHGHGCACCLGLFWR